MDVTRDVPNNIGEAIIEISKFCMSRPYDIKGDKCDCPFWRLKNGKCIFRDTRPEYWHVEKVTKYKIHISE